MNGQNGFKSLEDRLLAIERLVQRIVAVQQINAETLRKTANSTNVIIRLLAILNFYSHQIISQSNLLTKHINQFVQMVEENHPPSAFIMKIKYLILIAHQLVVVGDTICRSVQESIVKNHVDQCSKALSVGILTVVQKSKRAAQLFPSVTAVQEMVDAVMEISHIVNDLKVTVLNKK